MPATATAVQRDFTMSTNHFFTAAAAGCLLILAACDAADSADGDAGASGGAGGAAGGSAGGSVGGSVGGSAVGGAAGGSGGAAGGSGGVAGGTGGGGGVPVPAGCSGPQGQPAVLYDLQIGPSFMAQDADSLYFFDRPGLTRAMKDGSGMALVALSNDPGGALPAGMAAEGVALDATHVYWAVGSQIFRAPKGGGDIEQVFGSRAVNRARELVVDDTHAYWVDSSCCGVYRVLKDERTLADTALLVDSRIDAVHLAVDATHVFWEGRGSLFSVKKDGTEMATLANAPEGIFGIQVDDSALYWVEFTGRVMRAGKDGTAPMELASLLGGGDPHNLRQHGGDLFVALGNDSVGRVAKDGSSNEKWSLPTKSPTHDVVADDSAVYWVAGSGAAGTVVRVCR